MLAFEQLLKKEKALLEKSWVSSHNARLRIESEQRMKAEAALDTSNLQTYETTTLPNGDRSLSTDGIATFDNESEGTRAHIRHGSESTAKFDKHQASVLSGPYFYQRAIR